MRKNKFLAALAIAACLATSVPLSASAATLGQAASASEVTYSKVSTADQAKIKEVYVAADYAELNPDLVAAGLSGDALFNHFITAGIFEGRQANKNFNVAVYKSAYADLQKEFKNDIVAYYVHYVNHGKAEGRSITTVDAAKSNGVEVKSLFSDKVILDKVVAAPASSSSSSNSGSSTPAEEEKVYTKEEVKALVKAATEATDAATKAAEKANASWATAEDVAVAKEAAAKATAVAAELAKAAAQLGDKDLSESAEAATKAATEAATAATEAATKAAEALGIKAEDDKLNEEASKKDSTIPTGAVKGTISKFSTSQRVSNAATGTSPTVSEDYKEVELVNGVEYDYKTGKFYVYDPAGFTAGAYVLDVASGYRDDIDDLIRLEKDIEITTAALAPNMRYAYSDTKFAPYDPARNIAIDTMDIRAGYPNNYNVGFYNSVDGKVTSEEAVATGINEKLYTFNATDGYWYQIVQDEKTAYKVFDGVNTVWNYKKDDAGTELWHTTTEDIAGPAGNDWRVKDLFVARGVTTSQAFNITEKGWNRQTTVTFNATENNKYMSSFLASTNYATVSEAGKENNTNSATLVRDGSEKKFYAALSSGYTTKANLLTYKDANGVNVGKTNNEYFEATPATGYYLDITESTWAGAVTGGLAAYLYTKDYKVACNFNDRDFMYVNGKIVYKAPINFEADEIAKAKYVKAGYVKTADGYYKVLAEKPTDNNNWLPAYHKYLSDTEKCYDSQKDFKFSDASVWDAGAVAKLDAGCFYVELPNTGSLLAGTASTALIGREVTFTKNPNGTYVNNVFELPAAGFGANVADAADLAFIKQYDGNKRFYFYH